MEVKTCILSASHHYMENDCIYVEIIAVVFVVKVPETNQTEHRFTHQKYTVSLVFFCCFLSPWYFHSYSIHHQKGGQIIPPFYVSKIVMILYGNWFATVGCFTMAKQHARIFFCISDATLLVLFSHPICSALLSPCENVCVFLPNVTIREHPSYATSSCKMPGLTVAWKLVVRTLSIKNISVSWDGVSLPEDNPQNVDRKAHRQYPFNRKILIIDSFQSQNSRRELEINSPYDKVCEQ